MKKEERSWFSWEVYRSEGAWPTAAARLISCSKQEELPSTGRNPERDQAHLGGASRGWTGRTSCPPALHLPAGRFVVFKASKAACLPSPRPSSSPSSSSFFLISSLRSSSPLILLLSPLKLFFLLCWRRRAGGRTRDQSKEGTAARDHRFRIQTGWTKVPPEVPGTLRPVRRPRELLRKRGV